MLEKSRRTELQSLHDARREVLDQHIGSADQVQQRLVTGLGLEVEHHAALVGVEHHELVRLKRIMRTKAQRLTAGRLDLDHLSAHLRKQKPTIRAQVDLAQFEDPEAVKRSHGCIPFPIKIKVE